MQCDILYSLANSTNPLSLEEERKYEETEVESRAWNMCAFAGSKLKQLADVEYMKNCDLDMVKIQETWEQLNGEVDSVKSGSTVG